MKISEFELNKLYKGNTEAKGTVISEDKADNKTAKKYRRRLSGKTLNETNAEYWEYILYLINHAVEYTVQERNEIVEQTAEYYWKQTGSTMPNTMITALADFLLDEDLANPDPWKVQHNEYNILSFRQLKKRSNREVAVEGEVMDYFSNENRYGKSGKRNTQERGENN